MKNEPAFPVIQHDHNGDPVTEQIGLTKLEYFAIQLMPVCVEMARTGSALKTSEDVVDHAIHLSNLLIQELERRGKE